MGGSSCARRSQGDPGEVESVGDGGRAVEWGGRVLGGGSGVGGRRISLDSSGCPGQTLGGPEWRGLGGLEEGILGNRKCHELMEEHFFLMETKKVMVVMSLSKL